MLVEYRIIILSLLVFMMFTLTPAYSRADDDFLVKFGQAYAQADTDDGEEAERPLVPPQPKVEQINRNRVIRQVLLVAKKIAETFGLVAALAAMAIFLFITHLLFVCYTIFATTQRREHLEDIALLVEERPWKTLGLGLLNFILAIIAISILFRARLGILGILLLSWFISRILDGFSARALQLGGRVYQGSYDSLPVTATAGALVLWPLFLIPVYGQVSFFITLLRCLGAKAWLRFRPRRLAEDTEVMTIDDDGEEVEITKEKASADTVIK